jgi:transcriptional regulator with XRE-family HTH domain
MILKLRKAHQLTRDELAAKLHIAGWDVSAEVVRQIELGLREVNDIELRIIAKRLKVPPAVLLE